MGNTYFYSHNTPPGNSSVLVLSTIENFSLERYSELVFLLGEDTCIYQDYYRKKSSVLLSVVWISIVPSLFCSGFATDNSQDKNKVLLQCYELYWYNSTVVLSEEFKCPHFSARAPLQTTLQDTNKVPLQCYELWGNNSTAVLSKEVSVLTFRIGHYIYQGNNTETQV